MSLLVSDDANNPKTVELRGEVGLLSHNVKFRGFDNPTWHVDIPACPDDFDPGIICLCVIQSVK